MILLASTIWQWWLGWLFTFWTLVVCRNHYYSRLSTFRSCLEISPVEVPRTCSTMTVAWPSWERGVASSWWFFSCSASQSCPTGWVSSRLCSSPTHPGTDAGSPRLTSARSGGRLQYLWRYTTTRVISQRSKRGKTKQSRRLFCFFGGKNRG